jgi:chondroitin AC lyase
MREFPGFIPINSETGISETKILSLFIPTAIEDINSHGAGGNAMDIALHYIYRGMLTEDETLLEETRDYLQLIMTDHLKADLILHDHGPQIQIGSYGWVFARTFTFLAYYLSNTPAAFDVNNENVNTVIRFIRETQILDF